MHMEHLPPQGDSSHQFSDFESSCATTWIHPDHQRAVLTEAFDAWKIHAGACAKALQDLAAIRHEFWLSEQGLQSNSRLCALYASSGELYGLLCAYARSGHKDYFIQAIATHPKLLQTRALHRSLRTRLLEAAMDESVASGWHGWVTCTPSDDDVSAWQSLGFYKHDDFTYRRMGYYYH